LDAATTRDEETLRAELTRAHEALAGLVRDLHGVDAELESLAPERKPYRLLELACGALEDLDELGAARLFWGERLDDAAHRIHLAKGRLDVFRKRLDEIEERRNAVAQEIDRQQERVELLEDELDEAERQEELRKLEWRIEREASALPARELVMPWTRGGEDDARYRRTLAVALLASVLLGLALPQIELPLLERSEPLELPERLTRLIQEARPLPPPSPALAPARPEDAKPTPAEEQPLVAEQPPQRTPAEGPGQGAGEGAGQGPAKGILAFREKFSGIATVSSVARLGSQARIRAAGAASSGQPERSLVTSQAPGSSGGINLAALSRDVGGEGGGSSLEGVQIARATSTIGGGAGSGRASEGGPGGGGPPPGRTDEEIQIVFDRYKSALYRLYNRELRNDPTLKGQMVLRIRIEPDGSVSLCELQATDMKAPQLAAQVVERVRGFDFGAKDVPALTILYPIDFLPAT